MLNKYWNFIFILIFLTSCKNTGDHHEHSKSSAINLNAEIVMSSGEMLEGFSEAGMSTFFNIAKFKSIDAELPLLLVFGARMKKGSQVSLKPIALIEFSKDSIEYQYIIANNLDKDQSGVKSLNYLDFSVNEIQTKKLIEDWFRLNCAYGACSRINWQNDYTARSLIESRLINQNQ